MQSHLFTASSGELYDTRMPHWSQTPLRANYSRTHRRIATVEDLKATLRNGAYAWPGGYPLYFVTADGAALSFATVFAEFRQIVDAIATRDTRSGWRVIGCEINYEDVDLRCEHTGELIDAAYDND